jgi:hypothetical protein
LAIPVCTRRFWPNTKSFSLVDTLSVGVDRFQQNFEPMRRQVESWRQTQITDVQAMLILWP